MKVEWKQVLLAAGGAAAVGVACYLLTRDDHHDALESVADIKKLSKKDATKEQVLMVLQDILKSQENMKALMKQFTQEFISTEYTFEEAYAKVAAKHPDDPLARYGLSMSEFDALLDKFQYDLAIKEAVLRIMGSATPVQPSAKSLSITRQKIIDVHEYMRTELQALVDSLEKNPNRGGLDVKIVTLTAQAFVGAKVQKQFGLSSEDIESAVLLQHKELSNNAEFARVNMAIQSTMNQLIGGDVM